MITKEKPFFTISNDYLFKCIMQDEEIRKYILKVCFNKDISIKKCSNVESVKEKSKLDKIKLNNKIEEKLVEKIKRYNLNKESYEKMKESEEKMNLEGLLRYKGREEGIKIGEKRGEIKGIQKNTLELAKRMLKEGATADFVSKVTGLSKKVLMTML